MKVKKGDYLTIAEAPNYEINGYLTVRNKKSGKKVKGKKSSGRNVLTFQLSLPKGRIFRSAEALYRRALAQIEGETWRPICSLDKKYELNFDGAVRNAATKKILKPICRNRSLSYKFSLNGKTIHRLWSQLMNEVNGTKFSRRHRPIKVQLQRDGRQWFFQSIKACARFLSAREFFSVSWLARLMVQRPADVLGWSAKYF